MRGGFEGGREHRLLQQPPAFLDLLRSHEVHLHQVGLVPLASPIEGVGAQEILVLCPPVTSGGAWLRSFGEPHLDTLMCRVCSEQAVQRGATGSRQSDHEDRTLDRNVHMLGIFGESGLAHQRLREQR